MMHNAPCKRPVFKQGKTKRLLRAAFDLFAPVVLALVVVTGCAAAGTGDYWLVLPEHGVGTATPAKSLATCQEARRAAWRGWLPGVPAGTPSRCERHPAAFSTASECIRGWNCK